MLKFLSLLTIFCLSNLLFAQRGIHGSYINSATNNQLNTYSQVTVNASVNATSITVAANLTAPGNELINSFFTSNLGPGDLIMIIQMQGATMDVDVTPTAVWGGHYTVPNGHQGDWSSFLELWGNITSYNNAGKYEVVEVKSISGTNTINLMCGLQNAYSTAGHVQIVRIPRLQNLTLNANTSISPLLWNGTIGGIVALEVNGNLTMNTGSKILATGFGFRGGVCEINTYGSPPGGGATSVGYCASDDNKEGAEKGEGIGGFYAEYDALYSRYCKSAPANGGGGGNNHNAGGGGGANVGIGTYTGKGNPQGYASIWNLEGSVFSTSTSSGGGRGGYSYSTANLDETTQGPNLATWSGDYRRKEGGLGGHPLTYDATRLFMGGGGGAGDANSTQSGVIQGGAGGRGGGIVFLQVYGTVTGTGTIESNGANGQNANPTGLTAASASSAKYGNDGAGGAGAGGSIVISNASSLPNTITLSATGGNGGNQAMSYGSFVSSPTMEADGPGGGGAGGLIKVTSTSGTQSVAGGTGGTSNSTHITNFPPNGATAGAAGISGIVQPFFDLTVANTSICTGNTATLTATIVGTLPGGATVTWYTSQFGSTVVGSGTTFTTPTLTTTTTYYVGTCPGTFRKPVTVTVGGPSISGTATVTNATCTTGGSITGLTASGGIAPLTITWNGNVSPTMNISNLAAGSYTVLVTDNAGCTATSGPYTITSSGGPTVNTTAMVITNANCLGNNGSITGITATGTGLTYSWNSNTFTTLDISGLAAGTYNLTVTDNNSCTASVGPLTITQTAGPSIDASNIIVTNSTCSLANGSISGLVATGNGLTYTWNGNTSASIDQSNLAAGSYTIVATDNIGCQVSYGPTTITSSPGPTVDVSNVLLNDEHCGSSDGSISGIVINGGTPTIVYSWNSGAYTTLDIASIPNGSYSLTITDGNGCVANAGPFTIASIAGPVISTTNMVVTDETCSGNDGSISGITSSGSNLTYQWNLQPSAGIDLSNQVAGNYVLTVTDAFGCTDVEGPIAIGGPIPMSLDSSNLVITPAGCTVDNGAISGLTVVGGVFPVVTWNNGDQTLDINNLAPGQYDITIIDGQNCTINASFDVTTFSDLAISTAGVMIVNDACNQGTGSISGITLSGGTTPYQYEWDNDPLLNNLNLTGASGGDHTIIVTDAVGCSVTATINVGLTNLPVINDNGLLVVDATCGNANGSISGLSITGSGPYTYVWMGTASTTLDIFNLAAGNYSLTVTDALGCSSTPYATVVNGAGVPNADFTYTSGVIVPGSTVDFNDASIGTAINSWEWSINSDVPFATSQNTSFLFANEGEYTVTLVIETAEGCIDSITKLITIYGEIIIPNVITVNGDQTNDVFDIINLKPNTTLIIQNRWGNVVFATEDYLNNWKGTDQLGNKLVEGTYFYQIITVEGNTWKGFVQLINKD